MYRHMWTFFRDKITAFQSNYREYIKGIKLLTSEDQMSYEGVEKDLEALHSVGVFSVFDFQEEDLEKSEKILTVLHGGRGEVEADSSVGPTTEDRDEDSAGTLITHAVQFPQQTQSHDDSLLAVVEQLEHTANSLAASLRDLRQRLKEKFV